MSCLDKLREALLGVTPHVYHFHAHKPPQRYIVWAEDGAGDTVFANGRLQNQAITGTVDLYTDDPEDTILFVTHDVEEAYALADRVVTLEQGVVRQIDAPERRIPEGAVQETVRQIPVKPEAKPRQPWKWICLAAALLAVIIGASVFHKRTAVPEEARLKISFVGPGLDAQRMEDDLLAALTTEGLEIQEIIMDSLRYDNGYTQGSAVWVRSREADLMIFTEEFLFDQIGVTYFPPLSGDWSEDHVYREGQTACGLLPGPRFWEYYDGEGQCVLFLTDAGTEKPAALAAARWLLEEG